MDLLERIQSVCRLMEREKIDVLVVASSAIHSVEDPDPVFHLSGHRPLGPSLLVVRSDSTSTLLVSPAHDVERAAVRASLARCIGTNDLERELLAALAPIPKPRIGTVNIDTLTRSLARSIGAALSGARSVDAELYAATGVKTDEEIENARKATEIAESGYERLLRIGHAGMIECELALDLRLHMESLGADDNFLMFNAGTHNRGVQPSSTRRIEKGDIVLAEISPSYRGQFTQICRSVSVGSPSSILTEKYHLVVEAMKAGIVKVKPGVPLGSACDAIDDVLTANGYEKYCKPPFIRRRGHGLGFGSLFPGNVKGDNDIVLEPNMFLIIHPNQYIPETGYLLCGEPLRVTDNGVEVLSRKLAALATIPA